MKTRLIIMAIFALVGLLMSLFSKNKLTLFCLYTPLKVFVLSLVNSAILWAFSHFLFPKIESLMYMSVDNKDLFFYPFFVCAVCSLSSYLIFLCKITFVREHFFLCFASFLILPLLLAFAILSPQIESVENCLGTLYYAIGFILPQFYFFIFFWRKNKTGEWETYING